VAVGLNWFLLLVVRGSMSWVASVCLCALLFVVVCSWQKRSLNLGN
jgi:hypothetical protein